jgi:nucleotide-binding universal stress UspA family protein
MARQKGLAIETISASGTVHQEIKNLITERGIDLLIIGELAHIRSRREAFYDEAERAMRSVSCSVLVVKDEERVWELYESTS